MNPPVPHTFASASSLARSFSEKCSFGGNASDSNGNAGSYSYAQFRGTPNEDRFSTSEEWEFGGHIWQLLQFSMWLTLYASIGHGGPTTAEYLSKMFPKHIRTSMENTFAPACPRPLSQPQPPLHSLASSSLSFPSPASLLSSPSSTTKILQTNSPASIQLRTSPADMEPTEVNRLNENNLQDVFTEHAVSNFLKHQVRVFDDELGNAVKALCPKPERIQDNREAREALYSANREVIARARCGSTMAGILIDKGRAVKGKDGENGNENGKMRMWVCCVGDSSVVLSTKQSGIGGHRKRKSVLVNKHHTGQVPMEYHRVSLEHPSTERDNIWLDGDDRIFGTLGMTRAFGDYMYKFPRPFTSALFSQVPSTAAKSVESVLKYNRTPPYVIADPFVTFMDLEGMKEALQSGGSGGGGGNDTDDGDLAVVIYSDGLEALGYKLAVTGRNRRSSGSDDSSNDLMTSTSRALQNHVPRPAPAPPSPADVIGAYVGHPRTKSRAEFIHPDGFPENKGKSNEAFDLMYNLLVKSIPAKLKAHLEEQDHASIGADPNALEDLYIDDVTVIVFRPFATFSRPGR
ncbi:hypothetical protein D9757_009528 [Collybiopsis confluens]|uniref:PPM-type phosphatase domain-containing protein n=1 Tax=Collybiopsis confluens TaxID=2823264 RepID=A0A8H5H8H1_9AGAR|nr:hypothetical protein D9757_009528 [Collybiopsis confluens]